MKQKKRSTVSWLAEFAGEKKKLYAMSVAAAILGVACSIVPYIIMGNIVAKLIGGNRDWQFYLKAGIVMAVFWVGRVFFMGFPLPAPIRLLFMCWRRFGSVCAISWQKCRLDVFWTPRPVH